MAVDFVSERDLPFIEVRLLGKLAPNEFVSQLKMVMQYCHRQNKYSVLLDGTHFVDWYSVIEIYEAIDIMTNNDMILKIKNAFVLPNQKEAKSNAHFWVTVCNNRCIAAREFENRQRALDWLMA